MTDHIRLPECSCSFCTHDEISTPDTSGEYGGVDEHMARLTARLRSLLPTPGEPACKTCKGDRFVHDDDDATDELAEKPCPDCGAQPVALRPAVDVAVEMWNAMGKTRTWQQTITCMTAAIEADRAARHMGERR